MKEKDSDLKFRVLPSDMATLWITFQWISLCLTVMYLNFLLLSFPVSSFLLTDVLCVLRLCSVYFCYVSTLSSVGVDHNTFLVLLPSSYQYLLPGRHTHLHSQSSVMMGFTTKFMKEKVRTTKVYIVNPPQKNGSVVYIFLWLSSCAPLCPCPLCS